MNVEKRLEQLHRQLQQLDKKKNNDSKLINAETAKLIGFYTKLCNKAQKKEDDNFISCLKHNKFVLDVSRIIAASEEDDVLSTYLNVLKSNEIVSIIDSIQIMDQSEKPKQRQDKNQKKGKNLSSSSKSEENKKLIGNRILRAICIFFKNLLKESRDCLKCVKLHGIEIENKKHWQLFGNLICKISSLKELSLTNMNLRDDGCEILCHCLKNCELNKLILSQCGLSKSSAIFISRLIVYHSNNRLSLEWQNKLRIKEKENIYNTPNFDPIQIGLTSIDLSGNNLDDNSLKIITNVLQNDKWIIWLDLRANNITKYGVMNVIEMLNKNKTLLFLDLRSNKQIPESVSSEICTILEMRKRENNGSLSPKQKSIINSLFGNTRNLKKIDIKSSSKKISKKQISKKLKNIKKTNNNKSTKNPLKSKRVKQVKLNKNKNKNKNKPSTNEILEKILSELKYYETTYESTRNECEKLKKQNKKFQEKINKMEKVTQNINSNNNNNNNNDNNNSTNNESLEQISQICDCLEYAFSKLNGYIDKIEEKNKFNDNNYNNNNKNKYYYYIDDSEQTDNDNHNAIEQRLREIWDSRLIQN